MYMQVGVNTGCKGALLYVSKKNNIIVFLKNPCFSIFCFLHVYMSVLICKDRCRKWKTNQRDHTNDWLRTNISVNCLSTHVLLLSVISKLTDLVF